jgi:hypothetical protein
MMSNFLRDIPFSHNKPLKLAEYVELSKINKAGNILQNRNTEACLINHCCSKY